MPVKCGGKWLPVENVFSSLQDIWLEAERLGWNADVIICLILLHSIGLVLWQKTTEFPILLEHRGESLLISSLPLWWPSSSSQLLSSHKSELQPIFRSKWAEAWHQLRNPCISDKQVWSIVNVDKLRAWLWRQHGEDANDNEFSLNPDTISYLSSWKVNIESLQCIASSLLLVCLDEETQNVSDQTRFGIKIDADKWCRLKIIVALVHIKTMLASIWCSEKQNSSICPQEHEGDVQADVDRRWQQVQRWQSMVWQNCPGKILVLQHFKSTFLPSWLFVRTGFVVSAMNTLPVKASPLSNWYH